MRILRFTVLGDPKSFATTNTKFRRGGRDVRGTRKSDDAMSWQNQVAELANAGMSGRPLEEGPIVVRFISIFTITRGRCFKAPKSWKRAQRLRPREWKITKLDGDKIERLILDAMEGVVYLQDAQVVSCQWFKFYGAQGEGARTVVEVFRASPALIELLEAMPVKKRLPRPAPAG